MRPAAPEVVRKSGSEKIISVLELWNHATKLKHISISYYVDSKIELQSTCFNGKRPGCSTVVSAVSAKCLALALWTCCGGSYRYRLPGQQLLAEHQHRQNKDDPPWIFNSATILHAREREKKFVFLEIILDHFQPHPNTLCPFPPTCTTRRTRCSANRAAHPPYHPNPIASSKSSCGCGQPSQQQQPRPNDSSTWRRPCQIYHIRHILH